ncbi:phospholipid scramblase 1-like [Mercenaria mercenaria]|uniref:phospholipid scramblase 1-like n=1 Tax=Mercenaria mercenaria TaxID=6596 RepID=UPI00234ED05D|nr:phospholipid scramblase 1-like [Mercenaria mercenaria]XP_053390933.1 phospholipid scramblase 1-like [Mercenaria mercenaria]
MTQVSTQPQKMDVSSGFGHTQGIQCLARLDEVIITQKIKTVELLTGFEVRNRFVILDNRDQQLFRVEEESDACMRACCPISRGLTLHITDNNAQEVMQISREYKCCVGCCCFAGGCCMMTLLVDSPIGRRLGTVSSATAACNAHMKVFDASGNQLYKLWGSMCPCQCCCAGCMEDIDYPVTDPSLKTCVGNVAKQWVDIKTTKYCVSFPANMSIEHKALLIGATFLTELYVMEQLKQQQGAQ